MVDDYELDEDDVPLIPFISKELLMVGASEVVDNLLNEVDEELTRSNMDKNPRKEKEQEEEGGNKSVYVRNDADWIGWSEEPPYFDEEDIEEDTIKEFTSNVVNSKFKYGGEKGIPSQSTNFWVKPAMKEATTLASSDTIPSGINDEDMKENKINT